MITDIPELRPHVRYCLRCLDNRTVLRPAIFGFCPGCLLTPDEMWKGGIFDPPTPDRPTPAVPGSPEKIRAMIRRVQSGRAPFHPDDPISGARIPRQRPSSHTQGCVWQVRNGTYRARVTRDRIQYHLGYFPSHQKAHEAVESFLAVFELSRDEG